ncbi:hypothetical protein [Streptomyces racemochromogenes]|uniref:hypothetical protein n=1 Tax=Streptomyces racemochromogenes TaxID=67353 RepID=UPI0031EAAE4F
MAFPAGTPTVTLVGTIPSAVAGTPFKGKLVCKPSAYLVDAGRNAVYPGGGSVTFDSNGSFSVVLLPCDAAGVEPVGWRWYLDLQPSGGTRVAFYANITGTGTVHFDDLAPVPAPGGGPSSGSAVTSVNGETGAVVLSAADVGADVAGAASATVAAHAAASDPHGDRAAAAAALAAHEADTTLVHGIADTAVLETQSGAQAKADTAGVAAISAAASDATAKVAAHSAASDPHGDRVAAASALAAHEADTTAVHGIADTSALETSTGAAAKVTAHKDALDPHGDRAWADGKFATQAALSTVDGYVNNALTRVTAIEQGTAWLSGLQVAGNAVVSAGDLTVSDTSKGYRFRRGGSALDFEATGADMILSNWSGTGFNGTQHAYLRLSADAQNVQVAGKIEFVDALYGATKHTLDPSTGVAALGAKNGLTSIRLCGRRASAGSPTTGAWAAGDAVQDSAGTWWLCTADGTPGTWTSPPATPTAHASTHVSGGTDPITVAQSQVTGLTAALAALLPLTGGTMTGTLTNNVASGTTPAFGGGVSGDTFDRWRVLANGTLELGPGNAARDTNLRRSAANELTTDDALIVSLMFRHLGTTAGFYGATAVTKPSVTGSRGGNAALASLLTALATLGLITDSTTA